MRRGLARAWRHWLIENLLLGVRPAKLVKVLMKAGLSRDAAREAIDREAVEPCFRGGFRATSLHRKLEGLAVAYSDLLRQAPWHRDVERCDALTAEELLQRYSFQGRPVIARDALPALAASGALRLLAPRVWLGPGSSSPRPARTDLLLYQVWGRRALALIPWCDFVAVRGRAGRRAAPESALQLQVSIEAGEALLIPLGWWYRPAGRAGGVAVCYQAGHARAPDVAWRTNAAVLPTAPPRAQPGPG